MLLQNAEGKCNEADLGLNKLVLKMFIFIVPADASQERIEHVLCLKKKFSMTYLVANSVKIDVAARLRAFRASNLELHFPHGHNSPVYVIETIRDVIQLKRSILCVEK